MAPFVSKPHAPPPFALAAVRLPYRDGIGSGIGLSGQRLRRRRLRRRWWRGLLAVTAPQYAVTVAVVLHCSADRG